jgi:hypothetical protein
LWREVGERYVDVGYVGVSHRADSIRSTQGPDSPKTRSPRAGPSGKSLSYRSRRHLGGPQRFPSTQIMEKFASFPPARSKHNQSFIT